MKQPLLILVLALMGLATAASAQNAASSARAAASRPHPAKPAFPQLLLADRKSQGQRAVDLLGARLPEVAAWYGKSPDELRALLLNDHRLKLDQRGRLFVEDELDAPLPAPSAAAASGSISGTLAPLDQTFLLHSRPGAQRTIYLNFRGAQLVNTAWNSGSGATITALPFDTDGLPYSNTQAELERIQYIWQRVVEDYAPFDVDVTTEPPPPDRLTRSDAGDLVFGTTVVITSRSGVYNCSCGGVAYVGIFDDTSDVYKPALVFYDALGPGNEKYVAEAISHEAGHNMGLQHDGYSGGGYYDGHGSGATGWAPIMGVGYYQPLVQWSKGEYATANNVQDDYVVMAANGLPLRADDHGNTIGTARALDSSSGGGVTTLSAEGVIERPSDVDVFSFSAGAGTLSLSVATAARSSNLDALIELRDSAGALLASANPVDALPATLSFSVVQPGTYYLTVQGVGKGDPLSTGYTDYGSLGQYAVTGSVTTVSGQPPTVVLSATPTSGTVPLTVAFNSTGSTDPDGNIAAYQWTFGDLSAVVTTPATSHVYTMAGDYTAQLKLTDNSGLTSTRSVTITVQAPVALVDMRVADIAMSLTQGKARSARAAVTVRNASGALLPGASVTGTWSGVVAGNASATTGSNGIATLNSPTTKANGTFTFTVTGITLSGHSYQPGLNTETQDSISR
ncbi:MAG: PKD domain-containing protein [Pseudomonadota bacterium]